MNTGDVRDFGAVGDGVALDSPAIQRAINASAGTGTVHVPTGRYRCGSLTLRSGTHLHLAAGAVLAASPDHADYPVLGPTPHGNHPGQIQALLLADGAEDLAIMGPGVIDGGCNQALSAAASRNLSHRPTLLHLRGCRDVRIQDLTLRDADLWTLHLLRCHRVTVRGVTIRNHPGRINTDGIDPDGCRDVIISDCHMVCGDDCIVLKSTEGDPCENVVVTNCVLRSSTCALKLGTESLGDIRNVTFANCAIDGPGVALALYLKDGGTYENVLFSGCVIRSEAAFPILVDHTPRDWRAPRLGAIRNVQFENLAVTGPGRCYVEAPPGAPVQNLSLRSISWTVTGAAPDFSAALKPRGSRRIEQDPGRVPHERQPFQFVAVGVDGLRLDGVNLAGEDEAVRGRGFLYTRAVRFSSPPVLTGAWHPADVPSVRDVP